MAVHDRGGRCPVRLPLQLVLGLCNGPVHFQPDLAQLRISTCMQQAYPSDTITGPPELDCASPMVLSTFQPNLAQLGSD